MTFENSTQRRWQAEAQTSFDAIVIACDRLDQFYLAIRKADWTVLQGCVGYGRYFRMCALAEQAVC
jgi:hypothetical protein